MQTPLKPVIEKKSGELPMSVVTIGFSLHRPELVPLLVACMRANDALFLEEPPTEEFGRMLAGLIGDDEYMMTIDAEYPQFTRMMVAALRDLHAQGKQIFQVEPYLESLLGLHAFFAEGYRPADLKKDTLMYPVYLAERNATDALLAYYQVAAGGSFAMTIDAVKRFARVDAARFRLRDDLRAQALSSSVANHAAAFIEAGVMHYPLKRLLQRRLSARSRVRSVFLADEIVKNLGQKGHLYGPGDQLTLLYILHPKISATVRETLLAARALVYSKIIIKEELPADTARFAHVEDELLCIAATRELSLPDCRRLFELIRGVSTCDARRAVADHVMGSRPRLGESLKGRPAASTWTGE